MPHSAGDVSKKLRMRRILPVTNRRSRDVLGSEASKSPGILRRFLAREVHKRQSIETMNSNRSNATFSNLSGPGAALHNSFQGFPPVMSPGVADMSSRRCISDSFLSLGRTVNTNRTSTVNMVVNRSGGATVKRMIETVMERCLEQESNPGVEVAPPDEECCVLAQCAADSYYKVVIAGRQGIPAIVRAMRVFPYHRGLQECCCLALGNLCSGGGANVLAIGTAGGVAHVIVAMRNHPQSVAVQSAACDALRNMSGLILTASVNQDSNVMLQLVEVLTHAKEMYLLPSHRSIADNLLKAITTSAIQYPLQR